MNILVCISCVPDTTTKIKFTPDGSALDKNGVQFIINPYDEMALTRALELKEAQGDGSVTVINVGGPENDPILRKCLAIGADQAVRVNAQPTDALLVSNEISSYAKDQNYDLIFTGRESIDYNGGQVCGMLGELLNLPSVNIVPKIEVNGTTAIMERDIDGGREEIEVNLPAVISAQKDIAEPRIPNMRGIMMAKHKPLTVVEPSGVVASTNLAMHEDPQAKGECKYIDPENMTELVRALHEEAKVI